MLHSKNLFVLLLSIACIVFAILFVRYYSILKGMEYYDVFMGHKEFCSDKEYLEGFVDYGFWKVVYEKFGNVFLFDTTPLDLITIKKDTIFKVKVYDSTVNPEKLSLEFDITISNGFLKKKLMYGTFDYGNLAAFWGDDSPNFYKNSVVNLKEVVRVKDHIYQLPSEKGVKKWFDCYSLSLVSEENLYSSNEMGERNVIIDEKAGLKILKKNEKLFYNNQHQLIHKESHVLKRKGIWEYLSFHFSFDDLPSSYKLEENFEYRDNVVDEYDLSVNSLKIWSYKKQKEAYEIRYYIDK